MSNNTQLLSRPIKSGCNFNAVGNPIVYKLRREDNLTTGTADDGGDLQLIFAGDLTAYYQVGDELYIGLSEYAKIGTVTVSVLDTGNTKVTLDIPYAGGGVDYINNLSKRTDYKVEVEVFDALTNLAIGPRLSFDYDVTGIVYADISGIVRAYLKADWNDVTTADVEALTAKKVYVKYQEFFNVTYWETQNDSASPIVGVFGIINILQFSPPNFTRYAHGGNLLGYFPNVNTAKWLTKFDVATMRRGYNFSLSVLWGIATMTLHVKQYNSAGVLVGDGTAAITKDVGTVVRIDLTDVAPDATRMLVTMENGADILLEEFTVEISEPCENPVYLFWKNSLGGDAFWMFDESQDYGYTNSSGNKVRRLTLYADNLTVAQWDGLNELNSISDIFQLNIIDYGMDNSIDKTHYRDDNQVYILSLTGERVGVTVINTDNKSRTLNKKHSIQLTIELPALYTV